ncbi:MAG: dicarboxylate/amino acid:cation symporter [Betaproteobacteria bacterium]|nr:dicarboxylate/amino acid:cation symporter [Betaproteobacteria bacterium]
MAWWTGTPLYLRILGALVLGVLTGLILGDGAGPLATPAKLILRLLGAIAPPLVFLAIVRALLRTQLARGTAPKLVWLLTLNTTVAIFIGLLVAGFLEPGSHGSLTPPATSSNAKAAPSPLGQFFDNIPRSLLGPFGDEGKVISVILVALAIGAAFARASCAQCSGPRRSRISDRPPGLVLDYRDRAFGSVRHHRQHCGYQGVWRFHRLGLFCDRGGAGSVVTGYLVSHAHPNKVGSSDFRVGHMPMSESSFASLSHRERDRGEGKEAQDPCFFPHPDPSPGGRGAVVHRRTHTKVGRTIKSWVRPRHLLRGMRDALVMAFSTASSAATMPLTYACLKDRVGLREQSASLGALVGANFNNDGTALYEAMAALFIAQMLGLDLSLQQQVLVVLTSMAASVGAAGIPEAGLVTMTLVFKAVGLPVEYIAILLVVDWFLDRCRTTINVLGDVNVSCILDGKVPQERKADST